MKRTALFTCLFVAAAGCGKVQNFPTFKRDSHDQNGSSPEPAPPAALRSDPPVIFSGSVSSAFDVRVDGISYGDIEEFYTVAERTLPSRVRQAGYDEAWTARLDAAIGFTDLWRDMQVFVSPVDATGYQRQSRVDGDGAFFMEIPADGLGKAYRVRANKRIDLLLTKGEERHRICYNFSAVERSVFFDETSLPVVLDSFETRITSYDCAELSLEGLPLPENP